MGVEPSPSRSPMTADSGGSRYVEASCIPGRRAGRPAPGAVEHDLSGAHDDHPFEPLGHEAHVMTDGDDRSPVAVRLVDHRRTRCTPSSSCPVVGSSSTITGVASPAPKPAPAACGATCPGRMGWSWPPRSRPTAARALVDGGPQLDAAQAQVARPVLDLGPNRSGEDLAIGVLEDQAHGMRELATCSRGGVDAVDEDSAAVGRSRPLRWRTSVDLPLPF